MNIFKKTFLALLTVSFFLMSSQAMAEDSLAHTVKSAIYGGVIGGLVSGAVVLISGNAGDNLGYIPTGIGAGILLGTAYGIVTSDAVRDRAFGEINNGRLTIKIPSVKSTSTFDKTTQTSELIESVDLLKVRF